MYNTSLHHMEHIKVYNPNVNDLNHMFVQTFNVISKYATSAIKLFLTKMLQQLFHQITTMTEIKNIQELILIQSTMITTSTQIQKVMMTMIMNLLIAQSHYIKVIILFIILLHITNNIHLIF